MLPAVERKKVSLQDLIIRDERRSFGCLKLGYYAFLELQLLPERGMVEA
jgi:hypothetical protein